MDNLDKFFEFFLKADSQQREAVIGKVANFRGLLKTDTEFSFISTTNLIRLYVSMFHFDSTVVVLLDPQLAIDYIPKITMLKRDDFNSYKDAKECDLIIVNFDSLALAEDWVFSFSTNKIQYEIYHKSKLMRKN